MGHHSGRRRGWHHLRERIWIVARPKEIAVSPVYGEIARHKRTNEPKTFSFVGKIPRAGRMDEDGMHELVPLAPRKTKRENGWSYWTGVNLLDQAQAGILLPTPQATDGNGGRIDRKETVLSGIRPSGSKASISLREAITYKNVLLPSLKATDADRGGRGDLIQVVRGNTSPSGHYSAGNALLPTPNAHGNGNEPENHMRKKAERCGGPRFTITDLEVIARNGFRQASGRLWPTTTTDAKAARNETSGRTDPNSKHHSGTTLLDALIKNGDVGLWPTPSAVSGEQGPGRSGREGGDNLVTRVNGSLNPVWVSWLMGFPLWWTDPTFPTEFTTYVPWSAEPLHVAPRVATGIPFRSQQLRALGNAVVPHCAWYALARALAATPEVAAYDLSVAA